MRKLPYREGDWFVVPLKNGNFAIGLVARVGKRGIVLGYFFAAKRGLPPALGDVLGLQPRDAVLVCQFGDLALVRKDWPVLGPSPNWERDRWPVPAFCRREELTGRCWRVEYADDNLSEPIRETLVAAETCAQLPTDDLLGAGAVEIVLTHVLHEDSSATSRDDGALAAGHDTISATPVALSADSVRSRPAPSEIAVEDGDTGERVLVIIKLSDEAFGSHEDCDAIRKLEDSLSSVLSATGVGDFDGNEVGLGFWDLYMSGPSADRLFEVVAPILRAWPALPGSYVVKRYGGPGSREERVDLWPPVDASSS